MFTGIVTDVGTVAKVSPLTGRHPAAHRDRIRPATIAIGASISCAGVCLTVAGLPDEGSNARWFEVEAWEEALRLTTASEWAAGTPVNLERALKIGDELGGHIVSGHVDGMAKIVERKDEGDAVRFTLEAPRELAKFVAPKGSVALDGTSLTVNKVEGARFDVLLDPPLAAGDDLGRAKGRRQRQSRGGYHGALCREAGAGGERRACDRRLIDPCGTFAAADLALSTNRRQTACRCLRSA